MIIAGTSFLIGSVFQASAKAHLSLLFIGRVFWGVGKPHINHKPDVRCSESARAWKTKQYRRGQAVFCVQLMLWPHAKP